MRVPKITNTQIKAKSLRIYAAKNKDYKYLNNKIMEITSVYSPYKSGKVVYDGSVDSFVEIFEPAKGLADYLKKLGINFNTIA